MIQTTNKYSKETFIRLNYWYDRIHGLVQEDIDKVNTMVEHIEKTRSDRYLRTGDNLFFVSGYGERSRLFFIDAVYGDDIIYGAQNETYIEGWEKKTSKLLIYKRLCKI